MLLLAVISTMLTVACSSDDSGSDELSSTTAPVIGQPDPPIPSNVNAIPFTVGAVAGLGNAEVSILVPEVPAGLPENTFVLTVTINSGALEPFEIRADMFRVYAVDGTSYTPIEVGNIPQFGNLVLASGESYTGTLAVVIESGATPALFLADLSDLGERFFPGAFAVDPEFVPESPES